LYYILLLFVSGFKVQLFIQRAHYVTKSVVFLTFNIVTKLILFDIFYNLFIQHLKLYPALDKIFIVTSLIMFDVCYSHVVDRIWCIYSSYVKCYLVSGTQKVSKRKTKVMKSSLNPEFNETFRYTLSETQLLFRTLQVGKSNSVLTVTMYYILTVTILYTHSGYILTVTISPQ